MFTSCGTGLHPWCGTQTHVRRSPIQDFKCAHIPSCSLPHSHIHFYHKKSLVQTMCQFSKMWVEMTGKAWLTIMALLYLITMHPTRSRPLSTLLTCGKDCRHVRVSVSTSVCCSFHSYTYNNFSGSHCTNNSHCWLDATTVSPSPVDSKEIPNLIIKPLPNRIIGQRKDSIKECLKVLPWLSLQQSGTFKSSFIVWPKDPTLYTQLPLNVGGLGKLVDLMTDLVAPLSTRKVRVWPLTTISYCGNGELTYSTNIIRIRFMGMLTHTGNCKHV